MIQEDTHNLHGCQGIAAELDKMLYISKEDRAKHLVFI